MRLWNAAQPEHLIWLSGRSAVTFAFRVVGIYTRGESTISDVEPSSESDNTEPVAQDSDVEPSDSGNDSDRDVVMDKVRGLSFSTCLQPTDPQYTATALCVAPAEGQHPLDFMLDYSCEALTFPAKFPFGGGTFTDERDVPITVKKYFVQRLLNRDKRFASDASYLFCLIRLRDEAEKR